MSYTEPTAHPGETCEDCGKPHSAYTRPDIDDHGEDGYVLCDDCYAQYEAYFNEHGAWPPPDWTVA